MTAFKLAIGDFIEFPVTLKVQDGATNKAFSFVLTARRLDAEAAAKLLTPESDEGQQKLGDFLQKQVVDWRGQTLVLGADDRPADFGPDAFGAMLNVTGAAALIYQALLLATAATTGKAGAQKN